ncbi:phage portal protein [Thalassospira marina]|uniref:Phage portal protein n=1 Tax=Thalassospira marina TaxID=2048283 RepID=A0A2N3KX25_9PROT|nr:phage portal protein [Thalassospira marina]PKR55040.1 phage portal protein [Thalassospira marina]
MPTEITVSETGAKSEMFTFGDPVPVTDRRELTTYFQSAFNGRYYEPPISFDGLAKALHANTHHESAIRFKVNLTASRFQPSKYLSRNDLKRLVFDYLMFGNAFPELRLNRIGNLLSIKPAMARWTRVKKDGGFLMLIDGQEHDFEPGAIAHIFDPDISQEIYGLPGYISALQSALLNEAATLFRRKYYLNGSHAGFILYVSDPTSSQADIDNMREALKSAKGPGNFRNLFYYSPHGKKDGIQLIPISEVTAKDEFFNMKNVTRDDVLAAHRVPPQLLGIVPSNAGGFGSIQDASDVFFIHEIMPIITTFEELNDFSGVRVVAFDKTTIRAGDAE